jgi:23S rRNA (adenine2503-C2)-methyltransferase
MKKYYIPTGFLFVDKYANGELETLSIGDYGKKYNVKADFLGYHNDINGVPNTDCMPLSEKWVVTVSTQYGCLEKCTFCDVPKYGFKGNVSFDDLFLQFKNARNLFPNVKYTERLNLHYARMGEPSYNESVFEFTDFMFKHKKELQSELNLSIEVLHPVLTTMAPKRNKKWVDRVTRWVEMKERNLGQLGMQFSINSTCDKQRNEMFNGESMSLEDMSRNLQHIPDPLSRKYCLNFALASNYEVNAEKLRDLFDPKKFMVKITPIHNNNSCRENKIETTGGYNSFYPYAKAEHDLKKYGFDVLVFVPSMDEEDGLVTCGNAVLGGSNLKTESSELKIIGEKRIL